MNDALLAWHDFNVGIVTASAGLLGLLFVALSLHLRSLLATRNTELHSVARTVFLAYVVALGIGALALMPQDLTAFGRELLVLVLVSVIPFANAARHGIRARGVGYDRRVTVLQYVAGIALVVVTILASISVASGDERALFVIGAVAVISLLWGLFNTWELIFRIQLSD